MLISHQMFSSVLLLLGFYVFISHCQDYYERFRLSESEEIPSNEKKMYQVTLVVDDLHYFYYGGTLISPYHVLTTALCAHGLIQLSEEKVVVLDTANVREPRYISKVKKIIVHEKYVYSNSPQPYDIALLKLDTSIPPTENVGYVYMPKQNEGVKKGSLVRTFSIGVPSKGKPLQVLQDSLVIVEHKTCKKAYNRVGYDLFDDMICAYNKSVGICAGEIGFGLIDEKKRLIGLVTQTITSCLEHPDVPALFTHVSLYIDWIKEHTSRDENNDYHYCEILRP